LNKPSLVNHVIIQEDIRYGESIRKYQLEGLVGKKWIVLTTGESIGQKRIEYFENVKVNNLRLKVIEADREIRIKNMSAYFVTNN
jgi:alpha-L-fucosidase